MEQTQTPAQLAALTADEAISQYDLKRSAKKVLTEALDKGWTLDSVERSHILSLGFIRFDSDEQSEAIEELGYRRTRTAALVSTKASFDPTTGAFWSGSSYTDVEYAQTAFPRPDSLSEYLQQLAWPSNNINAVTQLRERELAQKAREQSGADLFNEYVQSEEYEAARYERKKLEELAAFKPKPIEVSTYPERILRDAKEAIVCVLAAELAKAALAREGSPKEWHAGMACSPTTLSEAVDHVVLKAITDSWTSNEMDTELRKACEKVRRGF